VNGQAFVLAKLVHRFDYAWRPFAVIVAAYDGSAPAVQQVVCCN